MREHNQTKVELPTNVVDLPHMVDQLLKKDAGKQEEALERELDRLRYSL